MSRRVEELHPQMQILHLRFLHECERSGVDILTTCTYRSSEEQAALYAIGRTKPGHIVTNAQPGQSSHNFTVMDRPSSLAFDVVPLRDGKPVWGTVGDDGKLWEKVGEIGERVGLSWAGRWKTFKEFPHLELPAAKEIMRAGPA